MEQSRFLGLQWKLTGLYLVVGAATMAAMVLTYGVAIFLDAKPASALWAAVGAGFLISVTGSLLGFFLARQMKLRLWELGDFAERIATGDMGARLPAEALDEIGWLEVQLNRMGGQLELAIGNLRRLAEQNRQLAQEARRGASLEERAKLARDLHDTVNQQLFVLTMRSAAARKKLEQIGGDALALSPELSALEELARQAHAQTRELILQLRPTTLEQQGLGPALHEYVNATASQEGWLVVNEIDTSVRITGAQAEGLFRVAQEALNNVSKHAGARTVTIRLAHSQGGYRLRIQDDGAGFDRKAAVRPSAVGMTGMQERIAAIGGTFQIVSAPGEGTEIVVTIPAHEEADADDSALAGGRPQDGA